MGLQPQRHYSLADYFLIEQGSTTRHEFFRGEIFAMAGGTLAHNQIAANVLKKLGTALEGKPCRALGSDMRLQTPAGLLTYPDAMVICGTVGFAHERRDVVTNPTLLVEVLSDATRDYDLGEKFEMYRTIPSLREYLVLEQHLMRARLFRRQGDDSWTESVHNGADVDLELTSLAVEVRLGDLYDKAFES